MAKSIIERGGLPINNMQCTNIQYSFVNTMFLGMAEI